MEARRSAPTSAGLDMGASRGWAAAGDALNGESRYARGACGRTAENSRQTQQTGRQSARRRAGWDRLGVPAASAGTASPVLSGERAAGARGAWGSAVSRLSNNTVGKARITPSNQGPPKDPTKCLTGGRRCKRKASGRSLRFAARTLRRPALTPHYSCDERESHAPHRATARQPRNEQGGAPFRRHASAHITIPCRSTGHERFAPRPDRR